MLMPFPMTGVSPGLGDSINMAHCKMHYYTSHPTLNYFAVIPKGGEACWLHEMNYIPAPGLGDSVNMAHCKMAYYTSHPNLNYFAVIPKGGEACRLQLAVPATTMDYWHPKLVGYNFLSSVCLDYKAVIVNITCLYFLSWRRGFCGQQPVSLT